MKYDISFIGLGKLGLPLATNFAKKGKKVLAIDLNETLLQTLSQGKAPWIEEGLQDNIDQASNNIIYTNSYDQIPNSDYTIILVNTPSKAKDGSFSNEYVISSLTSTCEALVKAGKQSHEFVLSSTVMPGSIKSEFIPLIEKITGWELGKQFNFSYIPDFVAIGSVIKDFQKPDFVLIGSNDTEIAQKLQIMYACMLTNFPPTSIVSLPEAELAKVALNAYITTKISFANYLGLLAEKLDSGINIDNVTNAIGQDKRIGTKYLKAGGPYGGTCFPRDTWAFLKVSNSVGMFAEQMAANEQINNETLNSIADKVKRAERVGLVGLGFKPGTSVTTEGIASKLLTLGKLKHTEVFVFDRFEETSANLSQLDKSFTVCSSLEELFSKVDTVILCNGDTYYDTSIIPQSVKVVDPWRVA